MITPQEIDAGLRAYEQTRAFAALRRKRLPEIYVVFPILLTVIGIAALETSLLLGIVCILSAVFFSIFSLWNWRRLQALDLKNRALLANLESKQGDDLPWIQVERQQAEIRRIQSEQSASAKHTTGRIAITDDGFVTWFTGGETHGNVEWSKVESISAFKRDHFSIDLICLNFEQRASEALIEVDEDMEGYKELCALLPQKFEGFDTEWWPKVAHPAFATNYTELWRRSRSAA